MKLNSVLNLSFGVAVAAMSLSASAVNPTAGMLVLGDASAQEQAAKAYFQANVGGTVITPADLSKLDPTQLKAVWVHLDRCGALPEVPAEVKSALKAYYEAGGNLYLSKHATLLVSELGRIPGLYNPGIVGVGDGGIGTDIWTVNAHFGLVQYNDPENIPVPDPSQVYDHRNHPLYKDLAVVAAGDGNDYPHDSFGMLGNPDGLWREDHNCMWDLNSYTFSANNEGKNTKETFEKSFDCTVIGTWGHVRDYCVAGIVDFNPEAGKGRVLANGLAACEWAPREGVNLYHHNLELLTSNAIEYLAPYTPNDPNGVAEVAAEESPVYYTLDGVKVENPVKGIYVKVAAGKAVKVVL